MSQKSNRETDETTNAKELEKTKEETIVRPDNQPGVVVEEWGSSDTGEYTSSSAHHSPVRREPAFHHDKWFYRIAVSSLGVTLISATIGAIILGLYGDGEIPDTLIALGSGSVGALASLLAFNKPE